MVHGREVIETGGYASDIDLVFSGSPQSTIEPILELLSAEGEFEIVQKLHYDVPHCYYYILAIPNQEGFLYLHLDCMYDPMGINGYYFPANDLLVERFEDEGVYAPTPSAELMYLLVKKARKKEIGESTKQDVESLYQSNKLACKEYLLKYFDQAMTATICDALENGSIDKKETLFQIHNAWRDNRFSNDRWLRLKRLTYQAIRSIKRILKPSGIFVVLMGPDGSGKSTIAEMVLRSAGNGFRKTVHFHWRPGLLPRPKKAPERETSDEVVDAPSLKSKYGHTMSLVRFLYYYIDFLVGYWVKIYPAKVRTSLIIGERYYYDILVHPERYGFDLPGWLYRLLQTFVPKPDVTIFLSNEPEIIVRRKAELPIEEVTRQIAAYRALIDRLPGGIELLTDGSPSEVCQLVESMILNRTALKNRTSK